MDLSRGGVETRQHAVVGASPKVRADHDGCLQVATLPRMRPHDGRVGAPDVRRGDVAPGRCPDRAHGPGIAMGTGQVDKAVGMDRGRHRNVAAAVEAPEFLPGRGIVRAGMVPTVHDHLQAAVRFDEPGASPGGHVATLGTPQRVSVVGVQRRHERILLDVRDHVHAAVAQDRRTRESPLRSRHLVVPGVQLAEIPSPPESPHGVETEQPLGTEHRHDVGAVDGGRRVAVRGLGMPLDPRHGLEGCGRPDRFAGPEFEGHQAPLVGHFLGDGLDVAVQTDPEFRLPGLGGRRQEHAVAPRDWRGMRESRNLDVPTDVCPGGQVPCDRERLGNVGPRGARPAELGPPGPGIRRRARTEGHGDGKAGQPGQSGPRMQVRLHGAVVAPFTDGATGRNGSTGFRSHPRNPDGTQPP